MVSTLEASDEPTDELMGRAAPYNPRKIEPSELKKLQHSMRTFGVVEPIVVNRRSGSIVGGHQRVKAAAAEGIEALPVVWVDLDDASERQLNLALNKISGQWDDAALTELLAALDSDGVDLELTGFGASELDELLGRGESFSPADFSGERLDRTDDTCCPECGHVFAAYEHKVQHGKS